MLRADTTEHPAVWTAGDLHDLGLPPGATDAEAVAITTAGHVVVNAWRRVPSAPDPRADQRAFVWQSGRWTTVEGIPHAASVSATAANDRGLVVGVFTDSAGRDRAFAWRRSGGPPSVLAGDSSAGGGASANAVNNVGEVVGAAGRATAFVWRPGAADTLDYLLRDSPAVWSTASGVSDGGLVVGAVRLARAPGVQPFTLRLRRGPGPLGRVAVPARGGEYAAVSPNGALRVGHVDGRRAFTATDAGTRALAPVPGFDEARPTAVSDVGLVVGTASLPDPSAPPYRASQAGPGTRAVAWDRPEGRPGSVRLLPLSPAGCASDERPPAARP